MRSTRDELLTTLGHLETFVLSIEPANKLLDASAEPLVRVESTIRRQVNHAAFIVLLYAAFERYIEALVWARTELQVTTVKYGELWDKLRDKHLRTSGLFLTKGETWLGEGRHADTSVKATVANLHQCISEQPSYGLNRSAITHHDKNLRPDVVQELLSLIGIEKVHEHACKARPLVKWGAERTGTKDPVRPETLDATLNEIVVSRNRISHSGGLIDELWGGPVMLDKLTFMKAYCDALYHVVVGHYLMDAYVTRQRAVEIGKILEGPFKQRDGAIVVRKPQCRVSTGQCIFGQSLVDKETARVDKWGVIRSIRVDDKQVDVVEPDDPGEEIGLCVDFELTKSTRLFLLPTKDQAVWE